jgi:hypothetical protein
VNSEQLSEEELEAVKMRLGKYRVNVLLRRIVYANAVLTLDLFRVIILPHLVVDNNKFKNGLFKNIIGGNPYDKSSSKVQVS